MNAVTDLGFGPSQSMVSFLEETFAEPPLPSPALALPASAQRVELFPSTAKLRSPPQMEGARELSECTGVLSFQIFP